MGETCQISIGHKRIDFRIDDTLIEFHPIFIKRELKSWKASEIFSRLYRQLRGHQKELLIEMLTDELAAQYSHRRKQLISTCPELRHCDLVFCANKWEIYKHVIKRFSNNPPKWEAFKQHWQRVESSI